MTTSSESEAARAAAGTVAGVRAAAAARAAVAEAAELAPLVEQLHPAEATLARLRAALARARDGAEHLDRSADDLAALLPAVALELAAGATNGGPATDASASSAALDRLDERLSGLRRMSSTVMEQVEEVARLAVGAAAWLEPVSPEGEPLWEAATVLLARLPLASGRPAEHVVADEAGLRQWLAGVVTHVGLQRPALATVGPSALAAAGPAVLVAVEDAGTATVEVTLPRAAAADAVARLVPLGYDGPDGEIWRRRFPELSVVAVSGSVAAVLAVLGVGAGDRLEARVRYAPGHPDAPEAAEPDPSLLAVEAPTVDGVSRALARRVRTWIDALGLDELWVTVSQADERIPYVGHLGPDDGEGLVAEVSGNFYLPADARLDASALERLRALGWADPVDDPSDDEEIQPRNHTRVWPRIDDLDLACWHLVATLVLVYGLDPAEPVLAVVEHLA